MFNDIATAISKLEAISPNFLLIIFIGYMWWCERKERITAQDDYKKLDHEINLALNNIANFMQMIKDKL